MLSSLCCHVRVAFGQHQLKAHPPSGGTCCDSLALAQRDILLSRFLAECSEDPGGQQDGWSLPGERCPRCTGTQQGFQIAPAVPAPWAGLPDPGLDQQFDLWSVSKKSSILLTDFKLTCVLALLFAVLPLPSLALFLVNTVLFYLAPSLCVSPSSIGLFLILPPLPIFLPLPCPAGPNLAHVRASHAGASFQPGPL